MPSTPAKSERRKKLRKKPLRLIYVELAFGNGGMMRDLSEEGFAVRAMMPVKPGDKTPFSFTLGETTRVEGEGKVLWIDEGGRVAGVQFTQIASELRSQIDDWLIEDEKITNPREAPKEPKIAAAATIEQLKEEIRATPVRGESPAPLTEEATPVESRQAQAQPPPQFEAPKLPEPKIPSSPPPVPPEVKSLPTEPAAAKVTEPAEVEVHSQQKPQMARETSISEPRKMEPDATPTPVTSVADGFFRKWPKAPPAAAPVVEKSAPVLPTPAPTASFTSASRGKATDIEEEEVEAIAEHGPPLPDISEILIQPHGLSPHPDVVPQRSPELRSARQHRRTEWEWFTLGRALAAMATLTLLVGFLVYHRAVGNGFIWLGEALGGTAGNMPSSSPQASDDQLSDAAEPQHLRAADSSRSATVVPSGAASGAPPMDSAAKGSTAPVTPLSSSVASADAGQAEYLQAVQLMRGRNATNDRAEAVRLLWIAVEKGNPSAEVSLADMYWHGQGVVRNCDQARILFTAAARKGSSEAQRRLQQFQQEGCE